MGIEVHLKANIEQRSMQYDTEERRVTLVINRTIGGTWMSAPIVVVLTGDEYATYMAHNLAQVEALTNANIAYLVNAGFVPRDAIVDEVPVVNADTSAVDSIVAERVALQVDAAVADAVAAALADERAKVAAEQAAKDAAGAVATNNGGSGESAPQ